jgi:hypothetical protein
MSRMSDHIYKEGEKFYFDTELYTEDGPIKIMDFEDGDMIKWEWEGKIMTGTLREENVNLGLFSIENVSSN